MNSPNPAAQTESTSDQAAEAAAPSNSQTPILLLAISAIAALLMIGVLALQISEYLFYKAPPSAWPQPGAVAAEPAASGATMPAQATPL